MNSLVLWWSSNKRSWNDHRSKIKYFRITILHTSFNKDQRWELDLLIVGQIKICTNTTLKYSLGVKTFHSRISSSHWYKKNTIPLFLWLLWIYFNYLAKHLLNILGLPGWSLADLGCPPCSWLSNRSSFVQFHETRLRPFCTINWFATRLRLLHWVTVSLALISRIRGVRYPIGWCGWKFLISHCTFFVWKRIFPKRALIVNWFFWGSTRSFYTLGPVYCVCT